MRILLAGPNSPREFSGDLGCEGDRLPSGLVGVPVNELARALLNAGHYVHLVGASPDVDYTFDAHRGALRMSVVPYRPRGRERALDLFAKERREIESVISSANVDVIHAHWSYEFALPAVQQTNIPTLVTAHDAPLTVMRQIPSAYRAFRTVLGIRARMRIRNLTAVSPYLAEKWQREMMYRRPITVIPNIAPQLSFDKLEDKDDHELRILDIADESRRKNVKTLLRAFALVRQRVRSARLALIGGGLHPTGAIADWARANALADEVEFLGQCPRSRVAEELAKASVFCHTAYEESQPMCLLEAMAARVPVVAGSTSGGVPWTLDNGAAGVLLDISNPAKVADGICSVSMNPELARRLADRGLDLLRRRYSPSAVSDEYVAQYHKLLNSAP